MLIDSRIIQDSIERARRNKLDPEALSGSIGDADRSKRVQLPQREARYRTLLRRSIQALCEGRDPGDLTTIEDPSALEQIRAAVAR